MCVEALKATSDELAVTILPADISAGVNQITVGTPLIQPVLFVVYKHHCDLFFRPS